MSVHLPYVLSTSVTPLAVPAPPHACVGGRSLRGGIRGLGFTVTEAVCWPVFLGLSHAPGRLTIS